MLSKDVEKTSEAVDNSFVSVKKERAHLQKLFQASAQVRR